MSEDRANPLVLTRAEAATFAWLRDLMEAEEPPVSHEWHWRNHGFGERVIATSRTWRAGERVLDAGCGYSPLPQFLAQRHGVEMWGADDFGGADPFWRRGQDPARLSERGGVRYVLEPIGKADSSLPAGYFDVVYTKLGLHISPAPQWGMWRHFGSLAREGAGASIIVLANIGFATDGYAEDPLGRLDAVSALEDEVREALKRDGRMPDGYWRSLEERLLIRQASAYLYGAFLADAFGVRLASLPDRLRAAQFCCDPSPVVDQHYDGLLQAAFTRDVARLTEYGHGMRTPVLYQFERA